jgi:peptide/nickel transport system permease protein
MTSASTQNSAGTSVASLGESSTVEKSQSIRAIAWRRFRRHRMALIGLIMLALIVIYTIAGSFVFTEDYANDVNLRSRWEAPSSEFPMGTDDVGRDVMARTVYGGQISLAISVLAVSVTTLVGTLLGLIAGYYGGWLDNLIMRFAEALLSIPLLFLLLVLSKFIGGQMPEMRVLGRTLSGSVLVIILVLGFTTWMGLTRLVRANVLSLKEQEFVVAARALGARSLGIIFRHILPNTLAPIIVTATLGICNVILAESYVSFLGLGVQPPTASWGNMLNQAMQRMDSVWWLWFFPGLLILLTVLSVNFIGDGLRDALDPYSTK